MIFLEICIVDLLKPIFPIFSFQIEWEVLISISRPFSCLWNNLRCHLEKLGINCTNFDVWLGWIMIHREKSGKNRITLSFFQASNDLK
jgi:hypothetical protein